MLLARAWLEDDSDLMDIAVDTQQSVGIENPLRQVIVNTHSPVVFQQVPDDSVVFVKPIEALDDTGRRFKSAQFLCLSDTWRAQDREHAARGEALTLVTNNQREFERVDGLRTARWV